MTANKGDVIERIVRTKIGISELSRILHVSRTCIYNWFQNGHLNFETICKIGQAINHDFSNEFPEEFANSRNQSFTELTSDNRVKGENYEKSVNYWMNKYILLLERYNDLLTEITRVENNKELERTGANSTDFINNEDIGHSKIMIS